MMVGPMTDRMELDSVSHKGNSFHLHTWLFFFSKLKSPLSLSARFPSHVIDFCSDRRHGVISHVIYYRLLLFRI